MKTRTFIDQLNRNVRINSAPQKIVSLVPSLTEFLHYLGLEKEVVGITKFCIHPNSWFEQKERIGGTKRINIERIKAIQPDLVIGNKEENTKDDISALDGFAPVWMSDVNSFNDAIEMIQKLGLVLSKEKACNDFSIRQTRQPGDARQIQLAKCTELIEEARCLCYHTVFLNMLNKHPPKTVCAKALCGRSSPFQPTAKSRTKTFRTDNT